MTAPFYASSYARRGTTIPLFRQYPPQQTFTQLNLVDVYFLYVQRTILLDLNK